MGTEDLWLEQQAKLFNRSYAEFFEVHKLDMRASRLPSGRTELVLGYISRLNEPIFMTPNLEAMRWFLNGYTNGYEKAQRDHARAELA